jgi:hypothetical protein
MRKLSGEGVGLRFCYEAEVIAELEIRTRPRD